MADVKKLVCKKSVRYRGFYSSLEISLPVFLSSVSSGMFILKWLSCSISVHALLSKLPGRENAIRISRKSRRKTDSRLKIKRWNGRSFFAAIYRIFFCNHNTKTEIANQIMEFQEVAKSFNGQLEFPANGEKLDLLIIYLELIK